MTMERPLLAAKVTDAQIKTLKFPMLASPKIDGVRALVVDGTLMSRTMKPIRNLHTQALFGKDEFNGLDGELIVGNPWDKNLMQQTTSGVMSYHGIPRVRYLIFDRWDSPLPFSARWSSLDMYDDPIVRVPHIIVNSLFDMEELEALYLAKGYEGLMLRKIDGRYKQNRSTVNESILIKIKRFHDGEAIITGVEALRRNLNDATVDERGYTKRSSSAEGKVEDALLGSITVTECATGVSFSVGSGFTDAQRCHLWENRERLLGKIVKYKSFKVGVKDKPRFPIFLGFRDKDDM